MQDDLRDYRLKKLQEKLEKYNELAERHSQISRHASDNAPGSYVTGGSGRTRSQNRKTEQALDRTINHASKAVYWRSRAAMIELQIKWLLNPPVKEPRAKPIKEKYETPQKALFMGVFPTGIYYADRRNQRSGDYKTVGFIHFDDLEGEIYSDCPVDLRPLIEEDMKKLQAMQGQEYQVSGSGQMITLGYGKK